ncbi:MAG TPA: molybdenum cofactor guanylyltransferase [Bdellovibrionota bacterium]|nr:molybdenum cofactor guanylyltransferase [Bdellovibrionota bacterium]
MGINKALLPFNGTRLIDHMIGLLYRVTPNIDGIIVSGSVEETSYVPDLFPQKGPLGGLFSVLEHFQKTNFTQLLVIPVDMPLLTPELLSYLLRASHINREFSAIMFEDYELPLILRISAPLKHFLQSSIEEELPYKRSFHWLLDQLQTLVLPMPPQWENRLINANTPDQWREVEQRV